MTRYQLRHHTPPSEPGAMMVNSQALALVAAEGNFAALFTWLRLTALASEGEHGPFTADQVHASTPPDIEDPPPVMAIDAALSVLHRLELVLIAPD